MITGEINMKLDITLTEYTNGFALTAFDWRKGQLLSEVHEEKLAALRAMFFLIQNLIKEEETVLKGQL